MAVSLLVAIVALSAAAENVVSPIKAILLKFSPVHYPKGPLKEGEYLWQRLGRIRTVMIMNITIQFTLLNLIGIFASHFFVMTSDEKDRAWDWMDSIYWAIQTTTTIGYGDMPIPHYMRWFNIFYLALSTYFIGNALGQFGTMKNEMEEVRRYHSWQRRAVNEHMMRYLTSTEDTSQVDQYEVVVASLLNLGKITASDVRPIMDHHRILTKNYGDTG